MDVRPDEGMEGGVFAPYGGKYEGSGRDRGLTPFPRTSEEQGSKIQKRGAESTNKDYDYRSSVLFNLQQIGENAKLIRLWLSENSTYDWNPVCSFRDFIAHNYARVENKVIWKILTDDFPLMMNEVIRLKSL